MPQKLKVERTLQQIAAHVNGEVVGDSNKVIIGINSLSEASSDEIAFLAASSIRQQNNLCAESKAGAILISKDALSSVTANDRCFVVVEHPQRALLQLIPLFYSPYTIEGDVSDQAVVDPTAQLGAGVKVGPFAVIGAGVKVGAGSTIHPHVVIYPGVAIGERVVIHAGAIIREDTVIGSDCVIQNGAVVGGDGFGYLPDPKLGLVSIPQVGSVRLADRVDVGANACIDRAALGSTKVGFGTKIDNLVQIGHNVEIGSHSILCGQVGVAGSCKIGDQVVLAGQVGVADHLNIASKVRIGAQSGLISDVTEPGDYTGFPLVTAQEWRRQSVALRTLTKIIKRLEKLVR